MMHPINRLSWLRPSHNFLNALSASPKARWMVFRDGKPLVTAQHDLVYLSTADVRPLLGSEPFFGQGQYEGQSIDDWDTEHGRKKRNPALEAVRHRGTPIVFLGLHENAADTTAFAPSDFRGSDGSDDDAQLAIAAVAKLDGTPYFALDVAGLDPVEVDAVLDGLEFVKGGGKLCWVDARTVLGRLSHTQGGEAFAQAKSMVDWNLRNKFCPACGAPSYSMWGGWKIPCSTLLPWFDKTGRKPCLTEKGLHNFTHPRTDAVVIMVAIDLSGEKILLGRNKKFPGSSSYSALAGFIEPGESLEEAVQREMWEEAGVEVFDVRYHSTQPWPFPANLMAGFYATADSSKPIRTDLDNELADARWFTREEVLAVLRHPLGTNFAGRQQDDETSATARERVNSAIAPLATADPGLEPQQRGDAPRRAGDPPFRVPPLTAIAGVLIRDWAEGNSQAAHL